MKFVFPKDVQGWLTFGEGRLLFKLAQINPHLGRVVELGSYHGRSTICLAQGNKMVKGGKVFTVDKFVGDDIIGPHSDFYPHFKQNIKRYHIENDVDVFRGNTVETAQKWSGPIRLLFIDASHHYKDVSLDFSAWEKYLVPQGIIVFHDSVCWPGVYRLVCEVITSGRFKNFKTYFKPISPINGITFAVKNEASPPQNSGISFMVGRLLSCLIHPRQLAGYSEARNEKGEITPRLERIRTLFQFKILSLPKFGDRMKQVVKDRGEEDVWFKILGSLANFEKSSRRKR